jgi:hypothetical protein
MLSSVAAARNGEVMMRRLNANLERWDGGKAGRSRRSVMIFGIHHAEGIRVKICQNKKNSSVGKRMSKKMSESFKTRGARERQSCSN